MDSVVVAAPRFQQLGTGPAGPNPFFRPNLYAAHGDWRALVHPDDPAVPGEYVHFCASGLGPVTPPVPTGTPGPVSPLSTAPVSCKWQQGNWEAQADTLFAGLAPGMVGFYQLTVKVPESFSGFQEIVLNCVDWTVQIGISVTGG